MGDVMVDVLVRPPWQGVCILLSFDRAWTWCSMEHACFSTFQEQGSTQEYKSKLLQWHCARNNQFSVVLCLWSMLEMPFLIFWFPCSEWLERGFQRINKKCAHIFGACYAMLFCDLTMFSIWALCVHLCVCYEKTGFLSKLEVSEVLEVFCVSNKKVNAQ